jgi:hypothetical protein
MGRLALILVAWLGMLTGSPRAEAAAGADAFFGLLRVRDLTPFGFRRLDMRPSASAFAPKDGPSIELDLGYQNTWAVSRDVAQYLERRPRGSLTEADVAAIHAMPGEQFLVDMEGALLDVALNWPIDERLSAYAVLSLADFGGGFMDGLIEGFHGMFGFGDAGRPGLRGNQFNVLMDLKGTQFTQLDRSDKSGLLDPVLGVRYALTGRPDHANVVADAAIKIPVGSDSLLSSKRVDVGSQITAQVFRARHAFYANAAIVYYGGSPAPLRDPAMWVPTGILGYEYRWLEKTNLIAQAYASRSVFTSGTTDLKELTATKYQASFGLRQRMARGYWSMALTENVRNFNNTPDFGMQLGVGYNL